MVCATYGQTWVLDCASPGHHSAEALAGFMIFAFSVGLPLLYFGMLWTNRKQLFATDGSNQLAFLRFFYREYDEKLYYWETVECIRKSLLMGFASFFQRGTLMQLIAVIVLTVGYIAVLCYSRPYLDQVDDRTAITNQLMLFLTLVGALMVKVQNGFTANGLTKEGYDETVVNVLLIGSGMIVALAASFAIIHAGIQVLRTSSNNTQQDKDNDDDDDETIEDIPTTETEGVTAINTQKIIL
jgi:hypothetical protein